MELRKDIEQTIRQSKLVSGYLKGELSDIQQDELLDWINESEHNRDLFEKICNEENLTSIYQSFSHFDGSKALAKVKGNAAFTQTDQSFSRKLWPRIAAAAAIFIIAGAGLFYYAIQTHVKVEQTAARSGDIAPGKEGATLTLANGKKIRLSDAVKGELAREAGVLISKTANGELVYEIKTTGAESKKINMLSTANGETYKLRLPDGSLVALNAASSLEYPANFTSLKQRRVKLTGEGYFEIAKDKAHPFVVETDKQEVEVLGTHFNVSSYENEPGTRTTLLEGSVKINQHTVLIPGQQALLSKSGDVLVQEVSVNDAIAWINNKYIFDAQSIETIMRTLARWYDVEIVYQGDVKHKVFSGILSRQDHISKILNKITFTRAAHFKVEGRRVTVMP